MTETTEITFDAPMLANSLIELDRAHLVHPVASWRGHEAAGVRVSPPPRARPSPMPRGAPSSTASPASGASTPATARRASSPRPSASFALCPTPRAISASGRSRRSASPPELAELAPGDLDHVYFTLGGSDAVDSSVRFVRYYWHARGKPRKDQFISLEQGYHGSTTVGAGLTALPVFHAGFGVPTTGSTRSRRTTPTATRPGPTRRRSSPPRLPRCAPRSRRSAARSASPPSTPSRSRVGRRARAAGGLDARHARLCAELDILFVADEVITGFGRTGPLFACEEDGIVPDLMTVAKGLTSGYAPMGAVLIADPLPDDR